MKFRDSLTNGLLPKANKIVLKAVLDKEPLFSVEKVCFRTVWVCL